MRNALVVLLLACSSAAAEERTYVGPWYTGVTQDGKRTRSRKLEGIMTAVIKETGPNKWEGKFFGVWHGVSFSYVVKFTGKPKNLRGKAVIDRADYDWRGVMGQESPGWFHGTFTGSRYDGYFKLKEKVKAKR